MKEFMLNRLLFSLAECVGLEYVDIVRMNTSEWKTEDFIVDCKKNPLKFVHIPGIIPNPVYQMWLMRHEGLMGDGCRIVFTDVKEGPEWVDLIRLYSGCRFGSIFLMTYRSNVKPGVCPSQRGLYMK